MKKTSILTDFISAADFMAASEKAVVEKWEGILSDGSLERGKKFKKLKTVEPQLFMANVGRVEDEDIIQKALINGIQVELEDVNLGALSNIVFVDERDGRLSDFLRTFNLTAKIKQGGGRDIVQFTVPRLRFEDEVKALGMGARVGHGYTDLRFG